MDQSANWLQPTVHRVFYLPPYINNIIIWHYIFIKSDQFASVQHNACIWHS